MTDTLGLGRQASSGADPLGALADLGGPDIAAMLGMMLEAAAQRRAVILNGFVEGAAALMGAALAPDLRGYLFAAGECAETGHAAQLSALSLTPMFSLRLRLGEGTGGVLAALCCWERQPPYARCSPLRKPACRNKRVRLSACLHFTRKEFPRERWPARPA